MSQNKFWALDFDRCLGSTPKLYELFVKIIEELTEVTDTQLRDARIAVEQTGGSFDILEYLFAHNLLDDLSYPYAAQQFRAQALKVPGSMLEPGAELFLQYLQYTKQPFGIVSYGDPRWQQLKIAASGLDHIPHMIVPHKHKGQDIAAWYDVFMSAFVIPNALSVKQLHVETVVLVDDKAAAFDGLPPQTRGYWLQLGESLLVSQQGSIPRQVQAVRSFEQIIKYEKRRSKE